MRSVNFQNDTVIGERAPPRCARTLTRKKKSKSLFDNVLPLRILHGSTVGFSVIMDHRPRDPTRLLLINIRSQKGEAPQSSLRTVPADNILASNVLAAARVSTLQPSFAFHVSIITAEAASLRWLSCSFGMNHFTRFVAVKR